jgi:hypothetical protein
MWSRFRPISLLILSFKSTDIIIIIREDVGYAASLCIPPASAPGVWAGIVSLAISAQGTAKPPYAFRGAAGLCV